MKKNWLALPLMCGLLLTLTACGGVPATNGAAVTNDAPVETDAAVTNDAAAPTDAPAVDSDLAYVRDKGTLIVGVTDFAPMDYRDDNGAWIGFDADMAKAFAASLGVGVEFVEIDWDSKLADLQTKAVDALWNGIPISDELLSGASVSEPYCASGQVVVMSADKAADYQTTDSLSGLSFAVEGGYAAAAELDALGIPYAAFDSQFRALDEVASGACDACAVDMLMAGHMIGDGGAYPDLAYAAQLTREEYGVAFRTGSDLLDAFRDFWAASSADGAVMAAAETYGLQKAVILK